MSKYTLQDFDFTLPFELIANKPLNKRTDSRLLAANQGQYQHLNFSEIIRFFKRGDVLVLNNSRVVNGYIELPSSGTKPISINLNRRIEAGRWSAFAKPAKKLSEGQEFSFTGGKIIITKKKPLGEVEISLDLDSDITEWQFIEQHGKLPLPLYIKRPAESGDYQRYQTIYNDKEKEGSVAAPTAGLHFTAELLEKIKAIGVQIIYVTLHVGGGTFLPVKTDDITEHKMHEEYYTISNDAANRLNEAKANNSRIIAVGTTSIRTMESAYRGGKFVAESASTNIFITPGYKFNSADMLITNFHLPKSTLLMLVSAFAGFDEIKAIYRAAIANKYRFYSYGDAMILNCAS